MGSEPQTLYSGTFERSVDAKHRVAVPASWLSQEDEVFHVSPHPSEPYLMVMPDRELARWEERIEESALPPAQKRMAIRKFYGNAHAVSADKQGRILLNERHCERAGIRGEVVFLGGRSRFEIWSREAYEASEAVQSDAYRRAAEAIGL